MAKEFARESHHSNISNKATSTSSQYFQIDTKAPTDNSEDISLSPERSTGNDRCSSVHSGSQRSTSSRASDINMSEVKSMRYNDNSFDNSVVLSQSNLSTPARSQLRKLSGSSHKSNNSTDGRECGEYSDNFSSFDGGVTTSQKSKRRSTHSSDVGSNSTSTKSHTHISGRKSLDSSSEEHTSIISSMHSSILLTKTTAAQNGVAHSYRSVRGLYFLAVIFVRSIDQVHPDHPLNAPLFLLPPTPQGLNPYITQRKNL